MARHRPMAVPASALARHARLVAEVRFWTVEILALAAVCCLLVALALPVLG